MIKFKREISKVFKNNEETLIEKQIQYGVYIDWELTLFQNKKYTRK